MTGCLTEPTHPFGDYRLAGTTRPDLVDWRVPFGWNNVVGVPGDSVQCLGGSMHLDADGTWSRSLTRRFKQGGVWGAPETVSDSGTFFVMSGAGLNATLGMESEAMQIPHEPAVLEGRNIRWRYCVFERD